MNDLTTLDIYATQPVLAAKLKAALPDGTFIDAGRNEFDSIVVGQFHVKIATENGSNPYLIVGMELSNTAFCGFSEKVVAEKATVEEVVAWFVEWYSAS